MKSSVPDKGDIVWLSFTPQSGHEQAGRRPAVVLSPSAYNSRTGLMICVPVTTQVKGYPFEVPVSSKVVTELLCQIKSKALIGAPGRLSSPTRLILALWLRSRLRSKHFLSSSAVDLYPTG